ncbi:MAG: hypothetical protein QM773_15735 [Hyphomonadaceae bacterium]
MISDASSVDALGIEPGTGYALLVIADDLDWSDPVAHINALQQKIGAYVGFIHSGQIEGQLPEAEGRKRKIGIFMQYEPPENIVPILDGLGEGLAAMNIDVGYGPLPEGYEAS